MNKKGLKAALIFLLIFLQMLVYRKCSENSTNTVYQQNEGSVFGTIYHISYQHSADIHDEIREELRKFDHSLSIFNKESVISKVNQNDSSVILDDWFIRVFTKGQEISKITEGAFDMTVAPLTNAWGFGFKKSENVTEQTIDSILQFVGYQKIRLENGKIIKEDPRIMLDASAIAKGYACDVIAELLANKGIENYMVEIGGELNCRGKSAKGLCWRVGINRPIEDQSANRGEIEQVVSICEGGMATSGNYRNFYYKDGKKYAHTINPISGMPIEHSLLSASVIGDNCLTADAYATAFMVLGLERSMEIANKHPELSTYFICAEDSISYKIVMNEGFKQYLP